MIGNYAYFIFLLCDKIILVIIMKFKFKPKKSNLYLMIFMILVLLINSAIWLIIKEYLYFIITLILSLIIIHVYFTTTYIIYDDYFVTTLGFLKVKIYYKNIKKIEVVNNKVNVVLKNITIDLCPDKMDVFIKEIKGRMNK